MNGRRIALLSVAAAVLGQGGVAQAFRPAAATAGAVEDEYVRYELLAPSTNSFRVTHDLSVVTAGATTYVDVIPSRNQATEVSVIDLMSGSPLVFKQANGRIEITLARAVPNGGQGRVRILETLKDATSYRSIGQEIVFERPSSIRRGAVLLPKDLELIRTNMPVQVMQQADGRIAASFMTLYPLSGALAGSIEVHARARPSQRASVDDHVAAPGGRTPQAPADVPAPSPPMDQIRVAERAAQDREIVYFLKQPETHAFSLYHDYTASREGEHQYVNVVRAGSSVASPSAIVLDTGEALKTRTLTGADIAREKIEINERVDPDTEVVLIPFTPVKKGASIRLRISETYTDAARYALVDGQLMWHRSFGRNRNDMVLPDGWSLTTSSIPAVVTEDPDGRIRLSFWNPRPDNVDVFVKGSRR